MSNSKLNIDAGIDLYFYGKFFRPGHDQRRRFD